MYKQIIHVCVNTHTKSLILLGEVQKMSHFSPVLHRCNLNRKAHKTETTSSQDDIESLLIRGCFIDVSSLGKYIQLMQPKSDITNITNISLNIF